MSVLWFVITFGVGAFVIALPRIERWRYPAAKNLPPTTICDQTLKLLSAGKIKVAHNNLCDSYKSRMPLKSLQRIWAPKGMFRGKVAKWTFVGEGESVKIDGKFYVPLDYRITDSKGINKVVTFYVGTNYIVTGTCIGDIK